MDLTRVKDDDAEILDDRCYFPVVNVDMTLADKYADALPMLKQVTGHHHRHHHRRHHHRHHHLHHHHLFFLRNNYNLTIIKH